MGFVSAALGLLLGDRRRAVLLAVLLLKIERAASIAPANGLSRVVLTPARRRSVL